MNGVGPRGGRNRAATLGPASRPPSVASPRRSGARLKPDTSRLLFAAAWNEDGEAHDDDVNPDDVLLGRLVVATAIVAKARPVRIEAG